MSKDLSGRPPRPTMNNTSSSLNASDSFGQSQNFELMKTTPGNLASSDNTSTEDKSARGLNDEAGGELRMNIPPSPPTVAKTSRPPFYRTGWSSMERIASASLRLSRASTRTSLASDDLEKYMNGVGVPGGSLNNVHVVPVSEDIVSASAGNTPTTAVNKPLPPPRISSSGSTGRILSAGGRNQEFIGGASADPPSQQSHSVNSSSIPPPVKVFIYLSI